MFKTHSSVAFLKVSLLAILVFPSCGDDTAGGETKTNNVMSSKDVKLSVELFGQAHKSGQDGLTEGSSIQRFRIRVTILRGGAKLDEVVLDGDPEESTSLRITSRRIGATENENGTYKTMDLVSLGASFGSIPNSQVLEFNASNPVPEKVRDAAIDAYVAELGAIAGEEADSGILPDMRELIGERGGPLMDALGRMFVENESGEFEIKATLSCQRQGFWMGTAESVPVKIRIVDEGKFFDQEAFR